MMCQTKLFMFASLLLSLFFVGFSRAEPQCERINRTISDQLQCGYNYTSRFNFQNHFNLGLLRIQHFKSILKNCSAFVNIMICSMNLPRCTEEVIGPYLPCRGVCYDYANECSEVIGTNGLEWTASMCDILPEKDNPQTTQGYRERCFTPPNYKHSGKRNYKYNCSDIVIPECQGIPGYTKTLLSPKLQREYASFIAEMIKYNTSDPCSPLRKAIVCTNFLVGCVEGMNTHLMVCRDKCLSFFNTCKSPFLEFGSDICIEYPKREGSHKLPVCKQTHWPHSENWQLPENPTTSTATSGFPNIGAVKGERISSGTISGIVLGVIAILVAIVIGFILFRRYKQIKRSGYNHSLVANMEEL